MSYGMMRSSIEIYSTATGKDAEGFATKEEQLLFITKAYKKEQRGSEAWKNRAAFSTATTLFRFRKPPELEILTEHRLLCKGVWYNILSVEDVRDKGMYVEVLVERVTGSKG